MRWDSARRGGQEIFRYRTKWRRVTAYLVLGPRGVAVGQDKTDFGRGDSIQMPQPLRDSRSGSTHLKVARLPSFSDHGGSCGISGLHYVIHKAHEGIGFGPLALTHDAAISVR
jgi:hypothetical protein